jgi:hypothetical protein
MKFWTYTLTAGSLQINAQDGAFFVSILTEGTNSGCTVQGAIPFKQINPTAVTLENGEGVNFSALSPTSPLDGITITWVQGSVDIIVGF